MTGRWTPHRVIRAVSRRAGRATRLARATLRPERPARTVLARELGVDDAGLDAAVRRGRESLGRALPAAAETAAIGAALARAPGEGRARRAAADRAASRTVDLLGSGPVTLGRPIDWHRDFKSGCRWPAATHFTRISLNAGAGADPKVPWELSRGLHLVALAQSAVLDGRDDHAAEAVAQIEEWIAANPPEYGINWVSPMDAALRAVNWIWTAALLASRPSVSDAFYAGLLGSLAAHGRFIDENLEEHSDGIRTNHYLADVLGLLYIGLCAPALVCAPRWAAFARAALEREIEAQVLEDGASFESSIPYHRLTAEMFLSAAALASHHGVPFSERYLARCAAMLEFTLAYTKPDGTAPQIGDADDGRVHVLSGHDADPRDHRHLLAAGAVLFGREDFWRASGARWPEAIWIAGAQAAASWPVPPAPAARVESRAFPNAGVYILRGGLDAVTVAAGAVGTNGLGNHKHNDLLSIDVHLDGEDILVDAGTFVYSSDPGARNAFRSTSMHNTVMIDGVEQNSIPAHLFAMGSDAVPTLRAWEPSASGGRVAVEHDGYARLDAPVVHRRDVTLAETGVQIEDVFEGHGLHELSWTFLFAPGTEVRGCASGWAVRTASGAAVRLTLPRDAAGGALAVAAEISAGCVSPRYGVRITAPRLCWRLPASAPLTVRFALER